MFLLSVTTKMKVLTYNICFEQVTGQLGLQKKDSKMHCINQKFPNQCFLNVIKNMRVQDMRYDFIGLQESSYFNNIHDQINDIMFQKTNTRNYYSMISMKSGSEDMVTFYNAHKYTPIYTFKSEVKNGRPVLTTVFNERVIVINAHFSHRGDAIDFVVWLKKLNHFLERNPHIIPCFKDFRIVMLGDFNNELKSKVNLLIDVRTKTGHFKFLRRLYQHPNFKKTKTCCVDKKSKRNAFYIDQIFDSYDYPLMTSVIYPKHQPSSDHYPVCAVLAQT